MIRINLICLLALTFVFNAKANFAQNQNGLFAEQLERILFGNQDDERPQDDYDYPTNNSNFGRGFSSNYESLTERPRYEYKSSSSNGYDFYNSSKSNYQAMAQSNFEDYNSDYNYQNGGSGISIGGGGGGYEPVQNPGGNESFRNSYPNGFDITFNNGNPEMDMLSSPGNPDDPQDEVPLDGGIIALLGAGAAYGANKLRKKKAKVTA